MAMAWAMVLIHVLYLPAFDNSFPFLSLGCKYPLYKQRFLLQICLYTPVIPVMWTWQKYFFSFCIHIHAMRICASRLLAWLCLCPLASSCIWFQVLCIELEIGWRMLDLSCCSVDCGAPNILANQQMWELCWVRNEATEQSSVRLCEPRSQFLKGY